MITKTEKILAHLNLTDTNYQAITLSRSKLLELNRLNLLTLSERQNNGPDIEDMINFTCENPFIEVEFSGYIIGTERADHRLTIDCMNFTYENSEELALIVNMFHYADEFEVESEACKVRAWWD